MTNANFIGQLWNAGYVNVVSGGTVTNGTLSITGASEWTAGTVTTIGAGLAVNAGTITSSGTAASEWQAGTVTTLGSGLALSSGTISATASGGSSPFFNISAGVPVIGSFTQVGISGSTSLSQSSSDHIISIQDTGANSLSLHGVAYPAPSTPYRVAALVCFASGLNQLWGLTWGWSDGTKFETIYNFVNYPSDGYYVIDWSSSTVDVNASGVVSLSMTATPVWLGMRNDGTTLYFEFSYDGVNWVTAYSILISSAYCAPTDVFVGFSPQSSTRPSAISIQCFDLNGLTRSFP